MFRPMVADRNASPALPFGRLAQAAAGQSTQPENIT